MRPPRFWPWALVAMAVAFTVTWLLPLHGDWWTAVIGGFIGAKCGFCVIVGRWWLWRRRHRDSLAFANQMEAQARRQREVARWQ